ncbi:MULTISPECIES: 4'-phosphopantetheinyl transferase family protein [Micromonospora]|uniref:4'-phosphopantetheinyl transferase superfamily protein n=1 Tax=Micromonospora humidisoli TaxID=2807622 RepID=A0ABS2JGW1_9ACTN|nr:MULTISPECIES: 4'-phosphopantetheinyl transferase superfamily protein [Micromonospora]MBM7085762.1 4'-phosphopantetheinyl transferase superfamily protein [Micromonospora humidisoli]
MPADLVVRLRRTVGDGRATARALLVETAAAMAGTPPGAVAVEHTAAGAPVLGGVATGWHTSVSHTRGLVAVAVSRHGPVGIDVEALRPVPALPLSRRWFAPEDTDWLRGRPVERLGVDFLALWTGKEAVAKLYGTGLRGGRLLRWRTAPPAPPAWRAAVDAPGVLVTHRELPGHVLAVARASVRPGPPPPALGR